MKPNAIAYNASANLTSQVGKPICAAAEWEGEDDDDETALPVPSPAPVLLAVSPGLALEVTFFMVTSELSLEFVSVVPLTNHPASVLFAPRGGC